MATNQIRSWKLRLIFRKDPSHLTKVLSFWIFQWLIKVNHRPLFKRRGVLPNSVSILRFLRIYCPSLINLMKTSCHLEMKSKVPLYWTLLGQSMISLKLSIFCLRQIPKTIKLIYASPHTPKKQRKAKYRILRIPGLMVCGIENKNRLLFHLVMMLESQKTYSNQDFLIMWEP